MRRTPSAGLGFSRADEDLNIRRIGFVAAEIARRGELAVCRPDRAVRGHPGGGAADGGACRRDLVLVHVATPLAVCEARDRKDLYAKARAGADPGVHRAI